MGKSSQQNGFDTIVVGTGIGGLTAGLAVARKGFDVLLLEAGKQFGGMLNPFARRHYHFDVGIHYVGEVGERQPMRRILDSLGLEDMRFREIDPDCIDRYVFDGYEGRLVKGIDRWRDILVADFPHEQRNLDKFIELMKACRKLMRAFQGNPKLADLPSGIRHSRMLIKALRVPFSTLLADYFDDPLLRNVFAGPGGDVGLPPSRAGAMVSIAVLNHFLEGGYYPVGGSGAMRDHYVKALQSHGAEMLRNRLVERIEVLGDNHFAVYTNQGERFEARSVISNVDVADTIPLLQNARLSKRFRRKVDNTRPSLGAFCLFIGTDLDPSQHGLSDTNIWHYGTNDIESRYSAAFEGRIHRKPFFFLTVPTLKDPETIRAPKGHHTVELITFVPSAPFKPWFDLPTMKRGEAYEALKAEVAEYLLEGAEAYIPGLRDHAIVKEAATPATVWHFVRGRDGGIYGPEHSSDQMFHNRYRPTFGIPGMYLAGASVFGAGILTCTASGLVAGNLCAKNLRSQRRLWAPEKTQGAPAGSEKDSQRGPSKAKAERAAIV